MGDLHRAPAHWPVLKAFHMGACSMGALSCTACNRRPATAPTPPARTNRLALQGQEGGQAGGGVPHPGVRPAARVDRRRGEAAGWRLAAGGRAGSEGEKQPAAVAVTVPCGWFPRSLPGSAILPTALPLATHFPTTCSLLLSTCRTSTACAPPRPPPPATTAAPLPTAAAPSPLMCPLRSPPPPMLRPPLALLPAPAASEPAGPSKRLAPTHS